VWFVYISFTMSFTLYFPSYNELYISYLSVISVHNNHGNESAGITYGVVSSSWDPQREGSFLGWTEFQVRGGLTTNDKKERGVNVFVYNGFAFLL
jgi:hypothetical protein